MEKAFHMLTKNPEGGGSACPSNPPLRSKTHTGSSVARHTGFKGSVVCGGRWGVAAGGSGEGPCTVGGVRFTFKSPWAGHRCHVAEAGMRGLCD